MNHLTESKTYTALLILLDESHARGDLRIDDSNFATCQTLIVFLGRNGVHSSVSLRLVIWISTRFSFKEVELHRYLLS